MNMVSSDNNNGPELLGRRLFRLALVAWAVASLLRFQNLSAFAGLTFDDTAYAMSGRLLIEEGHAHWGDTMRPFAGWWVALLHAARGLSVVNVAIAFALLRCFGELFLILAVRRLFPNMKWAPVWVLAISAASFFGGLYGKQHLASLLFTVPLSLWLYGRWVDGGHWRDGLACSAAAGLVFLAHYNTIAALAIMFLLEMARLRIGGQPWRRIAVLGSAGLLTAFAIVECLGTWSYGFRNYSTFLVRMYQQITLNQSRMPPAISDGFLLTLASWEGLATALYLAGAAWILWRMREKTWRQRYLAVGLLPLLAGGLIWLRANLGYVSFPRLYVLALPFLWMATSGLGATLTVKFLRGRSTRFQTAFATAVLIPAVLVGFGHQHQMARYPSANAPLENYLRRHPTGRIALWQGNLHYAAYLFRGRWMPLMISKAEIDAFWDAPGNRRLNVGIAPEMADSTKRVYLELPDLTRVCDLVILTTTDAEFLDACDACLKKRFPSVFTTNFYSAASAFLPIAADEGGGLSQAPIFNPHDRLPLIRVYDLRGAGANLK